MGYRHYFYLVPKSEVELVKNMTFEDLLTYAKINNVDHDDESICMIDDKFLKKEGIYELGKLYWDNTADRIYSTGVPLFSNEETQNSFTDYCPYIVGKEGIIETIKIYKEKIFNYYKSLFLNEIDLSSPFSIDVKKEDLDIDKITKFFNDKFIDLLMPYAIDIDLDYKWIVTSDWSYEYAIFNLVHILKSIDWEEYTILFMGW